MSKSIVIAATDTADLEATRISPGWILNGRPETRSKQLARSHDRTSCAVVWDCTAGHFNWHYNKDETLVVLTGEAFISIEKGQERRNVHHTGKEAHGPGKAVSSKPSQHLLGPVSEENNS